MSRPAQAPGGRPPADLPRRLWAAVRGPGLAGVLSRGAASTLFVSGAGQLAGVAAVSLLTQMLGPRHWGFYAYAWTLINVTVLLGRLGLDTAELRYLAEYRVQAAWGRIRALLRFCDRTVLATSAAVAALSALAIALLAPRLERELAATLWVSCLVLPFFGLMGLRGGALQGLRRVVLARIPEVFVRPVATMLLAGLGYLAWGELDAVGAMWATLGAMVLAVLAGSWWLSRHLPGEVKAAAPDPHGREWFRTGLPLLFVSGMRLLLGQADILLVGALIGTTEAGIYTVASRLANLVGYGQNSLNSIGAPLIAELHAQGDAHRLQRVVTLASWGSTLFAFAATLVLAFGGRLILGTLFGHEFVAALPVLVILAAGQLVNAASGPVGYLLNMTGHQDANARILAWTVGLNVALNVPAIHYFGVLGSAVTTGALVAAKNLWTCVIVRRELGIRSSIFSVLRWRERAAHGAL